jgi:hypothetical protein
MSFTTLENTPININLVLQAPTTGWSFAGSIATHEICNAGSIYLNGFTIEVGKTYEVTYKISSITGSVGVSYVQAFMGDTAGAQRIATGFYTETLACTGTNPRFRFFSNTDCTVEIFNIKNTAVVTSEKQRNNIVYSEQNNKWSSFYTYNPDCGFGLFIDLYTFKNGQLYLHQNNSESRNNFYGVQYDTIVNLPFNQQVSFVSTFESMSIQSNMLMITTEDGIETSLGQISDLVASDFTKATLVDGATTVTINSVEGVYSASFLRDKNSVGGILNGQVLKGNYLLVELISTESTKLRLFSVAVHSEKSFIGVRG